jgi:beta-N-acetylhexosaminidase
MSLDEKLGQLLMLPFHGEFAAAESPEAEWLRQAEELHVGGYMLHTRTTPQGLMRGEIYATAEITNRLQERAKIPLLFSADFERGTAMRLSGGTSFPSAMAVAAAGNPHDAYEMGRITAREARTAGIHWIFAPVADVNSNPENPIINTRSFGEDASRAAEFVASFVRGVEEHGALATAKHFPGHGDTSADSHLELPRVTADRARLEKLELGPFRAAIRAGVSSIMSAHLAVPALEKHAETPATLSSSVLTDLLRTELGFQGLIVTDALDMLAIAQRYPPGEAAVRSILAGADVLLLPPSPHAAISALREAIASGLLPLARVEESVARILAAKARLGLDARREVDISALDRKISDAKSVSFTRDLAARGITLLRNGHQLLPLDATKPARVLLVSIAGDPDLCPGQTFERELSVHTAPVKVIRVDTVVAPASRAEVPGTNEYDIAIAALYVRVADRKGTVALPEDQVSFLEKLFQQGRRVIVVCFGSPYVIERFPKARNWLAAFTAADVAQSAAANALFGQTAIGGKLPVSIPGATPPFRIGDGLAAAPNPMTLQTVSRGQWARLSRVYDLLDRAVADGAFPGGQLAVGHNNELWLHAFGRFACERSSADVTPSTIYDVASLTKSVVTTTLVASAAEHGDISPGKPVGFYLPEWNKGPQPAWRAQVDVSHLLTHTSGLPAHIPCYESLRSKKEIIARVLSQPLAYEPGTKCEYSDLGFMLLGEIIERTLGFSLDELARERIFEPLAMNHSLFNPPRATRARIAPSGTDSPTRKGTIRGQVHDDNTWAMGGIAGHAGLFSNAGDLAIFAQMMLNGGIYAHRRILNRATVDEFTVPQASAQNTRTLGWAMRTEPSATGRHFSARSFGHSGFTGASLWCDPEKNLFVALLTNRTYPSRANEKIQQVRPALHDAVVESLGLASPHPAAPAASIAR